MKGIAIALAGVALGGCAAYDTGYAGYYDGYYGSSPYYYQPYSYGYDYSPPVVLGGSIFYRDDGHDGSHSSRWHGYQDDRGRWHGWSEGRGDDRPRGNWNRDDSHVDRGDRGNWNRGGANDWNRGPGVGEPGGPMVRGGNTD
jgi:hypothetical protein